MEDTNNNIKQKINLFENLNGAIHDIIGQKIKLWVKMNTKENADIDSNLFGIYNNISKIFNNAINGKYDKEVKLHILKEEERLLKLNIESLERDISKE